MRKHWFAAWAAAGMIAGCAGISAAAPGDGWGSAPTNYGPQQPASWTDKLTAPFKKNPFKKNDAPAAKPKQEVDPLSLAFKSGPTSPQLYVAMAEMAYRGGNADQARQLYQKALSMEPKHLEALLSAARMEDREGRLEVAIGLYDRAAKAHPKNPTALNDLGLCLARKGDLESGRRVLQQAVQLEPRKALYRNNIAKVLIEMNQLQAAAANLEAVHTPAVTHYNMAVLLAQRGRQAEASQALALALAIDPQMEPAKALLAQINPAPARQALAPTQGMVIQTARAGQSGPALPQSAPQQMDLTAPQQNNNSILPTPQPTLPGFEGINAPSEPWPAIPAGAVGASASGSQPLVLPPVN